MPRQIDDGDARGPGGADDPDQIITDENRKAIAEVLADPRNAWRSEPVARKRAHASMRNIELPPGADEHAVDRALERVLGQDDLVLTDWLRQGERIAETVALVRTPKGPATGFLISPWLLMTNNHVLADPDEAAASEALFRYAEDESGVIQPVRVLFDPQRCFVTSADLDFTVVALAPLADGTAPGEQLGRVRLIGSVGKVMVGQPVNIVQHPDGQSRHVAFRNNLVLSVDDERRLIYETDTRPGSSGSPVFNDRWQLVALHHRSEQARNAEGVEIDINGRAATDDTPEHLRNWVANAGIRVSRLVTDLRARQLEPAAKQLIDESLE
jgi:endonuclease G, mitochondrial